MKKLQKIISAIYLSTLLIDTICLPLSAIFILFKLCEASSMSWIGCFIPVVITLATVPIIVVSKALIDEKMR